MQEWCRQLDRLKVQLGVLESHEGSLWLDAPEAMKQLDAARAIVQDAMPFTTCNCGAKKLDCEHCKGREWVIRSRLPGKIGEVVA